jgi:hypothetical protein
MALDNVTSHRWFGRDAAVSAAAAGVVRLRQKVSIQYTDDRAFPYDILPHAESPHGMFDVVTALLVQT